MKSLMERRKQEISDEEAAAEQKQKADREVCIPLAGLYQAVLQYLSW